MLNPAAQTQLAGGWERKLEGVESTAKEKQIAASKTSCRQVVERCVTWQEQRRSFYFAIVSKRKMNVHGTNTVLCHPRQKDREKKKIVLLRKCFVC